MSGQIDSSVSTSSGRNEAHNLNAVASQLEPLDHRIVALINDRFDAIESTLAELKAGQGRLSRRALRPSRPRACMHSMLMSNQALLQALNPALITALHRHPSLATTSPSLFRP